MPGVSGTFGGGRGRGGGYLKESGVLGGPAAAKNRRTCRPGISGTFGGGGGGGVPERIRDFGAGPAYHGLVRLLKGKPGGYSNSAWGILLPAANPKGHTWLSRDKVSCQNHVFWGPPASGVSLPATLFPQCTMLHATCLSQEHVRGN